jgi:acetyl esterase/lipase
MTAARWMPLVLLLVALATAGTAKSYQDVPYSDAGGTRLQLDAFIPDGLGPFPAAIIVHGGAWVTGDRRRSVRPLFQPLEDAGFAWFSINYRLADGLDLNSIAGVVSSLGSFDSAEKDVGDAVAYVRKHAAEYRIDPDRIALIGESAGAQLASMAALKPAPGSAVEAVVAFYSPSDLVQLVQNARQIPEAVRQAVEATPLGKLLLERLREQSPVNWVAKNSPPFLLIHGTADRLVAFDQSEEMCTALHKAGASCELYPVEGGGHGVRWWESSPGLTGYKRQMVRWLNATLRGAR